MKNEKVRVTNEILARFIDISNTILILSEERSHIRAAIIDHGPASTKDYVALVERTNRRSLAPIDSVAKLLKLTDQAMIRRGLMSIAEVVSVKVQPKKPPGH